MSDRLAALWRELWDRFLLYLPLAFMGILALGTYWMVRSAPAPSEQTARSTQQHSPDYFMDDFSVRTFDLAGHIRSEVSGAHARHYPDTQWLEIDAIRIRSFDDKGNLTTATAKRGLTNEDGSEVHLLGDAYVHREPAARAGAEPEPGMEYRSEYLQAFLNTERVISNKPVELLRGADRFVGDSMDFDNVNQVMRLQGRVHGTLVPTPAKSAPSKKGP